MVGRYKPAGGRHREHKIPIAPHVAMRINLYVCGTAAIVGANTPISMETVLIITPVILTFEGGTLNSIIRKLRLSHAVMQDITKKVAR